MKIFISYRRKDSGREIGRIRDRLLAEFGAQSVFRDLVDIPAGADFREVLERETNGCDAMLVVIGPLWAGITDTDGNKRLFDPGDFTRIEVETGLQRLAGGGILVVPVLVMGAVMPGAADLPHSLAQLCYQNAIPVRDDPDFDHDMERLIGDIKRSVGYAEEKLPIDYFEPETIQIREGRFWMGSPEGNGSPACEYPQHEIKIASYRIGRYPVTNVQYEEFVRQKRWLVPPSMCWEGQKVPAGLEKRPVTGVSWFDALAYCHWLSERTGRSYSLPNEAQWEKACRGSRSDRYPWGNDPAPDRSNFGRSALADVDAFPPQNEFGLYDLVGNVRQWTLTLWGEKRLAPDPQYAYPWRDDRRNDPSANRQIRRVVRGGSFQGDPGYLRCSARSGEFPEDPGLPGTRHGFRVVMRS